MILYFSGTGNSAHAARRIAHEVGDIAIDLFDRLRNKNFAPMNSQRPWVVVAPTYAWRLPRILEDWLLRTELQGSQNIYFILTCGDGIGNAGKYAAALCKRKGMFYCGCGEIVMPENYIAMFNAPEAPEAQKIVQWANLRIDEVCTHIAAGNEIPPKRRKLLDGLLSGMINPLFYKFSIKDKKFRTLNRCIGCGLCAQLCPTNNITFENGKPQWNGKCTHCMACICRCPQAAIEYGKISVGKPRYICPEE